VLDACGCTNDTVNHDRHVAPSAQTTFVRELDNHLVRAIGQREVTPRDVVLMANPVVMEHRVRVVVQVERPPVHVPALADEDAGASGG